MPAQLSRLTEPEAQDEVGFSRLARDFPNITIIRVKEALATMRDILNNLGLGIRAMSRSPCWPVFLFWPAHGQRHRARHAVVLGGGRGPHHAGLCAGICAEGWARRDCAAPAAGRLWADCGAMQAEFVFCPYFGLTVLGAADSHIGALGNIIGRWRTGCAGFTQRISKISCETS